MPGLNLCIEFYDTEEEAAKEAAMFNTEVPEIGYFKVITLNGYYVIGIYDKFDRLKSFVEWKL